MELNEAFNIIKPKHLDLHLHEDHICDENRDHDLAGCRSGDPYSESDAHSDTCEELKSGIKLREALTPAAKPVEAES